MNFQEVFIDSLSYPFRDLKRFFILFVLFLGSFLLIPIILAYGYNLRIIKHSLNGEKGFPDFNNKGDLLSKGIDLLVVSIIYAIPNIIVTLVLLQQFNLNSISNNFAFLTFSNPVNITISIVMSFIVSFVYVVALANMVHEDNIRGAFAFKRIFHKIKEIGLKKYTAYLVMYSLILILIGYFSLIIVTPSLFHGIGIIFGLILTYVFNTYLSVFESRFRGLIYPIDEMKTESNI